jgi:predicted phosphodiesterase
LELFKFEPDSAAVAAADVIVLAGDIHKGSRAIPWARAAFPDKPIVYVAGNHEYYDHYWFMLIDELRAEAKIHNVHFLENDAVTIGRALPGRYAVDGL